MKVFGLSNCDSTRSALKWLKQHGMDPEFHDLKLESLQAAQLRKWLTQIPLEKLMNKQSTTWRGLTTVVQESAMELNGAVKLMVENPSLVKRPLTEWPDNTYTVGFTASLFEEKV